MKLPELNLGFSSHQDIYSLAVCIFAVLTEGRFPFTKALKSDALYREYCDGRAGFQAKYFIMPEVSQ